MAEAAQVSDGEALPSIDQKADEAIAMHGANARQAVASLRHELELARIAMSFGYSRGWHHLRSPSARQD